MREGRFVMQKLAVRALSFAGVLGAVLSTMCSSPPPPPIITSQPTSLASVGGETSATFSRAACFHHTIGGTLCHPDTVVTQFNGGSGNSWAFSTNGGFNWNTCDVATKAPKGCGFKNGPVPLATSNLLNQANWNGDPSIAASPDGLTVVMANMANFIGQTTTVSRLVIVSTSTDGGQHFTKSFIANLAGCPNEVQIDQEALTADPLVANQYYVAWRDRVRDSAGIEHHYGACGVRFRVDPDTGSATFDQPNAIPTQDQFNRGVGGLLVDAHDTVLTVMYADTDIAAGECGGTVGVGWKSVTSFNAGSTWPIASSIDSTSTFRTCLPDETSGIVQPGMRDFGLASDTVGTLWAAVPSIADSLGFRVFTSTNFGATWTPFTTVEIGRGAYSFFPTLTAGPLGRIGLSFQALGTAADGSLDVTTFFAAHRPSDAAFVGPVAISLPYIGNRPPPQGTCGHSLCTVDGPLLAGCDPLGCVAAACQVDSFCCDLFDPNGWSRSCAFMVGNTFNNGTVSVCPGFTCGGRVLGDYAGGTSITTGNVGGGVETFIPVWTQGSVASTGYQSTVAASVVTVNP
jgi:hypothetical protein